MSIKSLTGGEVNYTVKITSNTDKLMTEYIRNLTSLLPSEENELIEALFFEGKTERGYAKEKGIYHNAVHKKKIRILEKLKKILEN